VCKVVFIGQHLGQRKNDHLEQVTAD
jgi:hypothetical protein